MVGILRLQGVSQHLVVQEQVADFCALDIKDSKHRIEVVIHPLAEMGEFVHGQ